MADTRPTLTNAQLEDFRRRLEAERDRLLALLGAPTALVASDDERTEFEETAQRAAERTDRLAVAERERALLADVERALGKLAAGTYGLSERTGEPIPYERLDAVPWARDAVDG